MRYKASEFIAKHSAIVNISILFIAITLVLALAEVILRANGRYATFNEKYGHPYHSLFDAGHKSWYHIYEPHQVTSQTLKEYSYSIMANNEGLLDEDFVVKKKPHSIRIMVIGDSFVQGMGAGTDSTCPKLLEGILRKRYGNAPEIEVWNCGIGNSDPFFEYVLFANRLLKYEPDYVIEVVNSTDITDVILRGGFKRFNSDSTVTYNSGPWFEPIYEKSFVVRGLVHDVLRYNWCFLRPEQEVDATHQSEQKIDSALTMFEKLCSDHHIPLLLAFHPRDREIDGTAKYPMEPLIRYCDLMHFRAIDIRPCWEQQGFAGEMSKALFWPIDGHCNGMGYSHFAECLSTPLISYIDSVRAIK